MRGALLRALWRYADRYGLSARDRLLLAAHYPLFKAAGWARFGRGPRRALGAALAAPWAGHAALHHVAAEGRRVPLWLSFDLADLSSFQEVFWGDAYAAPFPLDDVRTYVDLGANTGMAFLYFLLACPRLTRAVLVEPNPRLADALRRRVAPAAGIDVEVVEACVSGDPAPTVRLTLAGDHRHSGLGDVPGGGRAVDVANGSLSALLRARGLERVDLLKMDIEGAERGLLEADAAAFGRIDRLCAELHGDAATRDALVERLGRAGLPVVERRPGGATYETSFARAAP